MDVLRWLRGAEEGEEMPEVVVNPWRPGRTNPGEKAAAQAVTDDDETEGRIAQTFKGEVLARVSICNIINVINDLLLM